MEIYKLNDELSADKLTKKHKRDIVRVDAVDAAGISDGARLKVTDLKQGVKNPNRVNVFVNGKYALSLDVAQVVDYGVKIGLELSNEKLTELKRASEFGKLYQRTLEWVLMRPRSEREVRDYLMRKLGNTLRGPFATNEEQVSEVPPVTTGGHERVREEYFELSKEIIDRLIARGYLDDRRFAEFWVENRFVKKGVSRKRLRMELMKKGVARDIVDEVLEGRNDEEEIRKMIAKKRAKYDDEKLIAYLCRQGFDYQLAQSLVRDSGMD